MQVTEMERGHGDAESQLQQAKSESKKLKDELTSISTKLKKSQGQVEQLNKAAMKSNASSYQQSIQLESQIQTLQAEKQIMEQQRDIANTERERVITDCVGLKKKLEAMMLQRQKDAKDLSAMRHVKEKAFQVSLDRSEGNFFVCKSCFCIAQLQWIHSTWPRSFNTIVTTMLL